MLHNNTAHRLFMGFNPYNHSYASQRNTNV